MAFIDGKYLADRYDSNSFRLLREMTGDTFVVEYSIADSPPSYVIKWRATISGFATGGEVTQSLPFGSPFSFDAIETSDWFVNTFIAVIRGAIDTVRRFGRMTGVRPY